MKLRNCLHSIQVAAELTQPRRCARARSQIAGAYGFSKPGQAFMDRPHALLLRRLAAHLEAC